MRPYQGKKKPLVFDSQRLASPMTTGTHTGADQIEAALVAFAIGMATRVSLLLGYS